MKKRYYTLFLLLISAIAIPSTEKQAHTLFFHGMFDTPQNQIKRFNEAIATDSEAIKFEDAQKDPSWNPLNLIMYLAVKKIKNCEISRSHMHLGQENDILQVKQAVEAQPSDQPLILFGCSRGAATVLTAMGTYNFPQVKALVLDAAPAVMHETLYPKLRKLGIQLRYAHGIFRTIFPNYPKNPLTALGAIKDIKNKELPILILHSMEDVTVPYEHALKLYQECKKQGFVNVHLVMLPKGKHAYLLQNLEVKEQYLRSVHSFYKTYRLPYNEQWATEKLQNPSIEQVEREIQAYEYHLGQS